MQEISVIVPVYNVENKIRRCIDSVLAQTLTEFELILIDDGSSDRSGEICDEYAKKDARIRVIHQENKGAAEARNVGIKSASGKYLGFVDSDDYIDPDYLSELYCAIVKADSDIAMCCYYMVSENGDLTAYDHRFSDGTVLDRAGIISKVYSDIYYNRITVGYFPLWNKLIRKELVASNNIMLDRTMSFGEDMLFAMDCLKYADSIVFSKKRLYNYELLSTGLFYKYRLNFIDDIMKCYTSLIEQTRPADTEDDRCIELSVKYWYYVNRHIGGIVEHEKAKNKEIRRVLLNKYVQALLGRMAKITPSEAERHRIAQNELRVARLVTQRRISLAVFVARYQIDEKFWLRRLRYQRK